MDPLFSPGDHEIRKPWGGDWYTPNGGIESDVVEIGGRWASEANPKAHSPCCTAASATPGSARYASGANPSACLASRNAPVPRSRLRSEFGKTTPDLLHRLKHLVLVFAKRLRSELKHKPTNPHRRHRSRPLLTPITTEAHFRPWESGCSVANTAPWFP